MQAVDLLVFVSHQLKFITWVGALWDEQFEAAISLSKGEAVVTLSASPTSVQKAQSQVCVGIQLI